MKINLQLILIVAVILLTAATGYMAFELVQEKTERKSLEASQKILEADFASQQKAIENKLDSLKTEDHYLNEHIADVKFELADLDKKLTIEKSKRDEKDARVHRTNNADSLRSMVTRRYER
ncbi:hypothetical protein [Salinimicrobium sp. WS361]|uniref:hypothetical protein n=1 Tax=Salinimicrobium sp. WS361 TaxID=3425123 RepID=UPI003D6DF05A